MSAQVVSLEDIQAARRVGEEEIEQETCIPLIDADPEKLAIFLRPMSWEKRRVFFDSIVSGSLANSVKVAEALAGGKGKVQEREVMEAAHLGIHQAIGQIIEYLGDEKPTCKDSAVVYLCSANPEHFLAARAYFNAAGLRGAGSPPYWDQEVFSDGDPLMMFLRISILMRPGLCEYWRKFKERD